MSLWTCPEHGLYGGQITCPKCGFQGSYTTITNEDIFGERLDLTREHRMIGPRDKEGHQWAVQDGKIFGWSESNVGFERAWWLNDDGTCREPQTPLMRSLTQTRPFDPEWLNEQTA